MSATKLRRPLAMSRRGLVVVVVVATALSSVVPVCAAIGTASPGVGVAAVAGVLSCAAWRVSVGLLDPRRPSWVVHFVDVPLTVVWASGVLGLPVAVLGLLAQWLVGPGPTVLPCELGSLCGLVVAVWGVVVRRRWVKVRGHTVPIRGLAPEFAGYRIAQLSDLHYGSVDALSAVRGWVRRTNALGCDLIVITGDLVTSGTRYYAAVADALGELRARDGVFVVSGNHDLWSPDAWRRELQSKGLRVLSHEATTIRRGQGTLVLVGLDATRSWEEARRVLQATRGQGTQVVLAHYPEAFHALGEDRPALLLSGHTHGGQLALPWIDHRANLTRLMGGPISGLRRSGEHHLHVSRGLGTTGIPLRLGAAPEISVITLQPDTATRVGDAAPPHPGSCIG